MEKYNKEKKELIISDIMEFFTAEEHIQHLRENPKLKTRSIFCPKIIKDEYGRKFEFVCVASNSDKNVQYYKLIID